MVLNNRISKRFGVAIRGRYKFLRQHSLCQKEKSQLLLTFFDGSWRFILKVKKRRIIFAFLDEQYFLSAAHWYIGPFC